MTTNYQEVSGEGTVWKRCTQVFIDNPLAGSKIVRFSEETVVSISDQVIKAPAGFCQKTYVPESTIELLNPETLTPTGEVYTESFLYNLLFSAYIKTAMARDNQGII